MGPYSELKFLWERWESSNLLYGICDVTPSDWYLVSWDVTISKRIDVIGNVNLVILDGHTVTFEDGIHVAPGSTLNIYGQSNDSGVLKSVAVTNKQAAIGGNGGGIGSISGKIKITGGEISAIGGGGGAGIGTGFGCNIYKNTDITINGGTITAYGGYSYSPEDDLLQAFGAGIGAGGLCYYLSNGDIYTQSYFGGNIYLNGGNITVKNVGYISIGTTHDAALDGVSGNVYFNGATVVMGGKDNNYNSPYGGVPLAHNR